MRAVPLSRKPRGARRARLLPLASRLALACAVSCAPAARAQNPAPSLPGRLYNVEGFVALPDDRPAARVRVRITGRGGVSRETHTNDNGRFEFPELPGGLYLLAASTLNEPSLAASAEADTTRTAVGRLTVNLYLRAPSVEGGRPRAAAVSAAEAGQVVPPAAQKAFKRGLRLKRDGRPDEALASFTRAVELYPDYSQALAERGDLRVARRELAAAEADFERALKVNARYAPALRGAGYCRLEGRDFARAAEYLERAEAGDPANVSTVLLLGIANLELDRRDAARQSLQKALRLGGQRAARAHIHLANLYAREGRYQQAADELRLYLDAVVLDPDYDELRKTEARWRALAGKQ